MQSLFLIFISAFLVNNIVLMRFLGLCPWIGASNRLSSAIGMSVSVIFVMFFSSSVTWIVYNFLLLPMGLVYLRTMVFVLVIGVLVQLVELFLKKRRPSLYKALGIYLPLIATNCIILGVAFLIIDYNYNFIQSLVFTLGVSLGFMLAMIMLSSVRERIDNADIPPSLRGAPIAFITASLMSLAFLGFKGLFGL
ncbi:MAG: RnfABCDGE type electron transport complex subunit A [bacterium]|nr:RnfABCDGE type electron transport complex subunit A [bacterium]